MQVSSAVWTSSVRIFLLTFFRLMLEIRTFGSRAAFLHTDSGGGLSARCSATVTCSRVQRMRGPGLALTPTAMAGMDNQWRSDQTITNLPARASAFHVRLYRGVVSTLIAIGADPPAAGGAPSLQRRLKRAASPTLVQSMARAPGAPGERENHPRPQSDRRRQDSGQFVEFGSPFGDFGQAFGPAAVVSLFVGKMFADIHLNFFVPLWLSASH
jgi:hypothetical protein